MNPSTTGLEIVRRIGLPPKERGSVTELTCPDILELGDGRFAVIGTEATEELRPLLAGVQAAIADYERIVIITRETLLHAKDHIPSR